MRWLYEHLLGFFQIRCWWSQLNHNYFWGSWFWYDLGCLLVCYLFVHDLSFWDSHEWCDHNLTNFYFLLSPIEFQHFISILNFLSSRLEVASQLSEVDYVLFPIIYPSIQVTIRVRCFWLPKMRKFSLICWFFRLFRSGSLYSFVKCDFLPWQITYKATRPSISFLYSPVTFSLLQAQLQFFWYIHLMPVCLFLSEGILLHSIFWSNCSLLEALDLSSLISLQCWSIWFHWPQTLRSFFRVEKCYAWIIWSGCLGFQFILLRLVFIIWAHCSLIPRRLIPAWLFSITVVILSIMWSIFWVGHFLPRGRPEGDYFRPPELVHQHSLSVVIWVESCFIQITSLDLSVSNWLIWGWLIIYLFLLFWAEFVQNLSVVLLTLQHYLPFIWSDLSI